VDIWGRGVGGGSGRTICPIEKGLIGQGVAGGEREGWRAVLSRLMNCAPRPVVMRPKLEHGGSRILLRREMALLLLVEWRLVIRTLRRLRL
jgi:hypothetical protein